MFAILLAKEVHEKLCAMDIRIFVQKLMAIESIGCVLNSEVANVKLDSSQMRVKLYLYVEIKSTIIILKPNVHHEK